MDVTTRHSVCPMDCPDRCSLEVEVRDGRVESIDGSSLNPVTQGFICSKVRAFPKRVYGPERLLHPLRRSGPKGEGRFVRISWDEALQEIAARFRQIVSEHGGEAILPFCYGGSNGMLSQGVMDERLFRRLGASRLARTVCAAPTGAAAEALYGKMASTDFPDFARADYILIWGANPSHSNIHLVPYLHEAKKRGARLGLVDPRLTLPESLVDHHLALYPGTDLVVALAMIAHLEAIEKIDQDFLRRHATGHERLLERAREWTPERAAATARVPAGRIREMAEAYAAAPAALVRCGWGLERNRNAESAVAAVLALPAVAGKFGRPGSGYAMSASEAYGYDGERVTRVAEARTRTINMNQLGRALTEPLSPPVKALFVYDCNPLVTVPDENRIERGLRREDLFTVVFEQVMTDTAAFADLILPATTFLEHTEVSSSYGTYGLMIADPVIAPLGEARPNEMVFAAIGRALGFDGPEFRDGTEELARQIVGAIEGPLAGERTLEGLRAAGRLGFDFPGPSPVQFSTVLPNTEGRKVRLFPPELGKDLYRYEEDPGTERHPLALISPATSKTTSSTMGEYNLPEALLEIHPEDAGPRRIADRDWVRIFNDLGEVQVRARLSERIRPGVVNLPKGIWRKATRNGRVATALVPDTVTRVSGGACFNDARVQVARLST
jgi:anaerobic selenocysteine-containing dehydrogenase